MSKDTVQCIRDLVRPVLTISIGWAYIAILAMATYRDAISGKEGLTAIGTPLMMVLSYHFAKSSAKDKL